MRVLPTTSTPASVPFVTRLGSFGARAAVLTADGAVSYADLADRVAGAARRLGTRRRLVLVAGGNAVEPLVTYLAALFAGHPVLLVPGDNVGNLATVVDAYDPDVVHGPDGLVERRQGTVHRLHPDLALLLSTSGSTGSPKLVRLSRDNVQANAAAIADYLAIRPTDIAATTLPMHYCYGLSVVNSHLLAGAALWLTDLSVVDACFWDGVREHRVSTFAGVPYTFDLLDRVGFDGMHLPSLRYLTQAGGRLAPASVRRYAELGRRRGWDLFVMYGQTEATARMAYLPPDLALTRPSAIGVPVPGGSFTLEPLPEAPLERDTEVEVGELVYAGPNVMLGYAHTPADLARGRDVEVLRTGDVARRTPEGLYEIVGRRNRFAKVFGLRIDLDQVERAYADEGAVVACTCLDGEGGDRLVVAVCDAAAPVDVERIAAIATQHVGLPRRTVQVVTLTEVPRLPNGKPDYLGIASLARDRDRAQERAQSRVRHRSGVGTADRVRAVYAEVLGRDQVSDDDTFVSLEGDSLSYVEMSIRLEEALGHLPPHWHVTPVRDLVPADRPRRGRALETNVLLRAVAIVAIVATHANLLPLVGGAHVLLGVAGFNFGRFHLTDAPRMDRVRHVLGSVARVVIPSVLWIGTVAMLTSGLTWHNTLLLNGLLGPRDWSEPRWWYWFVEALVYTLLALAVVIAVPAVDRLERRWPFGLPMTLACLGLLTRYEVVSLMGGDVIHRANVIFWLFALGWASVKASTLWQRVLVSALVVATLPGFFDDPPREAVVAGGLLLLLWLRSVRVPGAVARAAGVLASASLYIYLAHWQIYPHLEDRFPLLATLLALLGGLAFWQAYERVAALVVRRLRARTARTTRPVEPAGGPVEPAVGCVEPAVGCVEPAVGRLGRARRAKG